MPTERSLARAALAVMGVMCAAVPAAAGLALLPGPDALWQRTAARERSVPAATPAYA